MSTPAPARSAWKAPREHAEPAGPSGRNSRVRGSGSGSVYVHDRLVDGEAVERGCLHHSAYRRYPYVALTIAERREVVVRMLARRMTPDDIAVHLGWPIPVLRRYAEWVRTGQWPPACKPAKH